MTRTEWQDKFQTKLLAVMKERGTSQRQLARDTGLSVARINDYVKGNAVPNIYAIINMAYALGTSPGKLIDFDDRINK